jgi:hypothetical protein
MTSQHAPFINHPCCSTREIHLQNKPTRLVPAIVAASTIALAMPASVLAEDSGFRPFVSAGMTFGGDTIATATYTDGSTDSIKGGELFQVGGGVQMSLPGSGMLLSFGIHYHADIANASNGKLEFTRIPFEGILYYPLNDKWILGGGFRYTVSPKATSRVDGGNNEEVTFKDSTGALIEIAYAMNPKAWLSLRFVSEEYKVESATLNGFNVNVAGAKPVDGSHVGAFIRYAF